MDRQRDKLKGRYMDKRKDEDKLADGWMDDGQMMNRYNDGWIKSQTKGWINRWMKRRTDKRIMYGWTDSFLQPQTGYAFWKMYGGL